MNWKQKICLWIGIIVIVAMGIYPSWVWYGNIDGIISRRNAGYHCILKSTTLDYAQFEVGAILDFSRLGLQWAMVAVITGGLIYTLKDKKPKDEQEQ